jgi:hypothetical protein
MRRYDFRQITTATADKYGEHRNIKRAISVGEQIFFVSLPHRPHHQPPPPRRLPFNEFKLHVSISSQNVYCATIVLLFMRHKWE